MRKLVSLMVMLLLTVMAFAQTRTITGKVTDAADSSPLPGVTVAAGPIAVQTDSEGNFSIQIPESVRTLTFSFVGFVSQEISVETQVSLDVALVSSRASLQEVVVVGYGTQKKKDVTAAIAKIDTDPISNLITPSLDRQLGGRASGIQVTSPSGLVNEAPRIRIRGVNSVNGSRGPLVVLDGVPMVDDDFSGVTTNNFLTDINPADVESVEVLKDGAGTAIYGSRAANGVLLITTKKGKSGRSNVVYSNNFGFSNPYRRFDLLNASEFVTISNEKFSRAGIADQAFMNSENTDTDWQGYVYRKNAFSQTHNLSVDGGNDKTTYFLSLNFTDQEGMVITNNVKRYGVRANVEHKVAKWLKLSNNITLSRTEDNDQNTGTNALSGAVANSLRALPNVRIFNEDQPQFSGFNITPDGAALGRDANLRPIENNYTNIAFVLANNQYNSTKHRIINNFAVEVKPFNWLSYTSRVNIDYWTGLDFQSLDSRHGDGRSSGGIVMNQSLNNIRWVLQNYFNANKSFGDHNTSLTLGTELQNERYSSFYGRGSLIADLFYQQRNLISNSMENQFSGGSYQEGPGFISYFGRLNYDYASKYYLQLSYRRDGLSRFAAENRFGNFPGVSVGWRISEEGFWNSFSNVVSEFKVRGSWATVGNDRIAGGSFPYLSLYGSRPYGSISGIALSQLGNYGLTWETQEKLDVGVDLGFLNDRLTLTFDWFSNKNNGLVLAAPLPVSFGVPGNSIYQNIGDMKSHGFELSAGGRIINNRNFTWSVNVNYTNVKNKVSALYLNQDVVDPYNIKRVGEPINALFGYEFAGVNSGNGNPMYYKQDGTLIQGNIANSTYYKVIKADDPALGEQTALGSGDKKILGNVLPTWFGGFSSDLRYKNLSLNIFLRYSGGNKIFNETKGTSLLTQAFMNNGKVILNRWQKPGDVTDVPMLWYGRDNFTNLQNNASSRFVESGNFLRLENVQLAYTLGTKTLGGILNGSVKSIRVFVQGQNLLLFTKYSGIDPENITEGGIDLNTVPRPRVISAGISIGL
ncbi:MAG: TonB-dependent receptor [Chitinophagaceae bacterium]|nr:TonB-dependent receptor [Chitinophagaceae bacterium]MCW5929384.1 TonB-dependent receptor [Chitinophagaceae bacterium]